MSKGIIVVNKIPQTCQHIRGNEEHGCPFGGMVCQITQDDVYHHVRDGSKPDRCPIKPIYGFDKKRKRIIEKLEKGMQYEMDESIKHRESENLFYYHWGMSKGYEHAIREIKGTVPDEQETL